MPEFGIPGFKVVGPTGKRDNIERLVRALNDSMPPGKVTVCTISHDDGCPCEDGSRPYTACTCETVDINLSAVNES